MDDGAATYVRRVAIIGDGPLRQSVRAQYAAAGASVSERQAADGWAGIDDADEYVILSDCSCGDGIAADNAALETLGSLAGAYRGAGRPVVHLALVSQTSLRMLQALDLPGEINSRFEVYPFTIEDVWAKNVLVQLPGIKSAGYPPLDREGMTATCGSRVHVVISGFDSQAEAVAIHAALVAHYPNYRPGDSQPLRTRITVIDEGIRQRRDAFMARYSHLFDNSYHRTVDIAARKVDFHYPMYHGRRAEFVDVEWEFVDAAVTHPEVSARLGRWAADDGRRLTIFVSHASDELNLTESLSLPAAVYDRRIPVMVRQSRRGLAEGLTRSARYSGIRPFGMKDCGYDVTLPLVTLARYLKYFYDCSYGNEGVPTELPADRVDEAWRGEESLVMRFSNIYNVMTMAVKMRSLGHDAGDADTFYALTRDEIETLAETEHNRWSVERLIQGMRPCTDAELEEIRGDLKTLKKAYRKRGAHFDLRAYSELEDDGTGKNARVYDYDLTACIPLIVKTFHERNIRK